MFCWNFLEAAENEYARAERQPSLCFSCPSFQQKPDWPLKSALKGVCQLTVVYTHLPKRDRGPSIPKSLYLEATQLRNYPGPVGTAQEIQPCHCATPGRLFMHCDSIQDQPWRPHCWLGDQCHQWQQSDQKGSSLSAMQEKFQYHLLPSHSWLPGFQLYYSMLPILQYLIFVPYSTTTKKNDMLRNTWCCHSLFRNKHLVLMSFLLTLKVHLFWI